MQNGAIPKWLPKRYEKVMLLHRIAIYLGLNPGCYYTDWQLARRASKDRSSAVKYLLKLAALGLVEVKAGRVTQCDSRRTNQDSLIVEHLDTPNNFYEMPAITAVVGYGATDKLVGMVRSGEFSAFIAKAKRPPLEPNITRRIMDKLAELHPASISVPKLKRLAFVSESMPALLYRLDQLAEAKLVVLIGAAGRWQSRLYPHERYYYALSFSVMLSAEGWLKIQRAQRDGVKLKLPKMKKWTNCEMAVKELAAKSSCGGLLHPSREELADAR